MLRSRKAIIFFMSTIIVFSAMLMPNSAHAAAYTVVKGDTLYNIGKIFKEPVSSIIENNALKGNVIYPGQVLNIPSGVHTVAAGDSLYLIARKYGIPLYSLRKANNKWNDTIYPGQKLIVPGVEPGQAGVSTGSAPSEDTGGKSAVAYGPGEKDLLARLITAEAAGEPYDAKVAVGAVVLNRVRDPRFPDSISNVIYDVSNGFYQFTPVENGWINKPASASAKNAANDALGGRDPSQGALFYFDDSATNRWLWAKPITARIGKMVYVSG